MVSYSYLVRVNSKEDIEVDSISSYTASPVVIGSKSERVVSIRYTKNVFNNEAKPSYSGSTTSKLKNPEV